MKYIFFGTPSFAAIVLGKLIDADMPPAALVCNPDRPVGRKKIITPPPTKQRIARQETGSKETIDILQPEKIDKQFLEILKTYKADFYVVTAYGKMLPGELLTIPPHGVIGVHPSLLPKLRGASPIQSAILENVEQTGTTLFLIDEKMDHGPIIKSQSLEIENQNYETLQNELAQLSGNLLIQVLPKFMKGEIQPYPQNETLATYTKKFVSDDGYIEYASLKKALEGVSPKDAITIDRKIRGLNPEPGVYTIMQGKRIKLLAARLKNGHLSLIKIQKEGRKPILTSNGNTLA